MVRLTRREAGVFLCVVVFFLCCDVRLLTTGYLELDDLGRVQIGYNLWAEDGRLLTAALMALLGFGGRLVDVSPLPQLGAIALMGCAGVLLARALPGLGAGRIALSAILLFATPFYLQNMTYVFDSLSMTAGMVLALWSALLLRQGGGGGGGGGGWAPVAWSATALLAALMFYQPTVTVFLCFAAAELLLRLGQPAGGSARPAARALLVLVAAATIDWVVILLLRFSRIVVFPSYQAGHAALLAPWAVLPGLTAHAGSMLALIERMMPPDSVQGVAALALLAGGPVLAGWGVARRGATPRRVALFGLAACVLLTGFGGPMLLLRDPVVQPRTLVGVGGMLSAAFLLVLRSRPGGRAARIATVLSLLLVACFVRESFAYGALIRDLDRAEASLLPGVALQLNAEHARTGLDRLQMLGAMPYPPAVRHGLAYAPVLAPLFDNPLNGISWFGVALLSQYGLDDGIVFRDPGPAAPLCRSYRETGPGYAVGHDDSSLVLIFRSGCR